MQIIHAKLVILLSSDGTNISFTCSDAKIGSVLVVTPSWAPHIMWPSNQDPLTGEF